MADRSASLRLFVALDVSAQIRQRMAEVQAELETAGAAAKWVAPELCHLTLKFLGYVPEPRVGEIAAACQEVALAGHAFGLEFRGVGAFPDFRRARVLWLGAASGSEEVLALRTILEAALEPLGFPAEPRPFSPHLTLGRFKEPPPRAVSQRLEDLAGRFGGRSFGTVSVEELRLVRSVLGPSGPAYTVLNTWGLALGPG